METKDCLAHVVRQIYTTIVATVENDGLPVTAAISMMDSDDGLYFLTAKGEGFCITAACTGCGACAAVCPQDCIRRDSVPFVIGQAHCLHCGSCLTACPDGAVEKR